MEELSSGKDFKLDKKKSKLQIPKAYKCYIVAQYFFKQFAISSLCIPQFFHLRCNNNDINFLCKVL